MNYICAIACVSAEQGLVLIQTYNKAVDQVIFAEFLPQLSHAMKGKPFALFMDRLKVHSCISVKDAMADLKITPILNVSYMPKYNPIEGCFSVIKNHYKRERLNCMMNEKPMIY